MRKLLLASLATLTLAGAADYPVRAQSYDSSAGLGADSAGEGFPTPGSVTVRLNGRVRFYADYLTRPGQVQSTPLVASNTPSPANGNTSNGAGSNKNASYGFQTYARLYPGFDGVMANGLKYGAAIEIRAGGSTAADRLSGGNVSAAGGGTAGTISQQTVGRSTLFVRRAYGYVGEDQYGTVRLGETDGPTSLYETGTFENFGDGGFNGDIVQEQPAVQNLVWPFEVTGNEYSTLKSVYLSPQWHGFDGGLSFEPNTGSASAGIGQGATGCNVSGGATLGCDQLAASPTYESQRRRNTIEALLRYRGTYGPVGLAATAAYITSGHVSDDGTPRRPVQFRGLDMLDGGLAVTWAGLTVGGHILAGHGNNTAVFALQKTHAKPELAWLTGASYTVGPVILGGAYVDVTSEGSNGDLTTGIDPTGQRREQGVSVGATYAVAPGFALFAAYDWDQRKEGNYDFLNGTTDANNNKIIGQILGVGTSFAW